MPLQKARANLALEAYCARLEELFSEVDVCVTALFIDVFNEQYGYRTTLYDDAAQPVRRADFNFPYRHHLETDTTLAGVQSDLYVPSTGPVPISVMLSSNFPNDEPSDALIRLVARSHAEYAFFYLTDGWDGSKFKLNEMIPMLKFIEQEKEEGIEWLKFRRKELEAKDLYGDPRHSVHIP